MCFTIMKKKYIEMSLSMAMTQNRIRNEKMLRFIFINFLFLFVVWFFYLNYILFSQFVYKSNGNWSLYNSISISTRVSIKKNERIAYNEIDWWVIYLSIERKPSIKKSGNWRINEVYYIETQFIDCWNFSCRCILIFSFRYPIFICTFFYMNTQFKWQSSFPKALKVSSILLMSIV